jgi:hypothetical protein
VKVHVDSLGSISSTFDFTCHGTVGATRRLSVSTTAQLELVRGRYKPVTDVCKEGKIRVAFNQYPGYFEVKDKKMVEYKWKGWIYDWEVLSTFFINHQLRAVYFDNRYTCGYFDTETQQWRGAVAMVRYCYRYNHLLCFLVWGSAVPNSISTWQIDP